MFARLGVRVTSGVTLAVFLSASVPAFAQAGVSEQLYHDGGELMKAGKTHEACAKFAASYRADNTAVGSLLATAACHEKEGKVAAAWGEYGAVAAIAARDGQADRQQYATDHAKALEPKLHHVIVQPSFDAASPPDGLAVQLDGAPFDVGAFNSQIPIDSGAHALSVTANGKKPASVKFTTADDTKTDTVALPALVDAPKDQGQTIVIKDESTTHVNRTKLALGFVSGGAGVIGLAVGVIFAVRYFGYVNNHSADQTRVNNDPPGSGQLATDQNTLESDKNSANTSGLVAVIGCGVGVVGLALGTYLIVTAPSKDETPAPAKASVKLVPLLGPGQAGLGLSGSF